MGCAQLNPAIQVQPLFTIHRINGTVSIDQSTATVVHNRSHIDLFSRNTMKYAGHGNTNEYFHRSNKNTQVTAVIKKQQYTVGICHNSDLQAGCAARGSCWIHAYAYRYRYRPYHPSITYGTPPPAHFATTRLTLSRHPSTAPRLRDDSSARPKPTP